MSATNDLHDMAIDVALVKQALNNHEEVCVERYTGIHTTLKEIRIALDDTKSQTQKALNKFLIGIIVAVLPVTGFLIQQALFGK